MSRNLDIIIKATTKGLNDTKKLTQSISDGFKRGRLAVKAFNTTAKGAERSINSMASGIKGLVGAYLGFEGLSLVTNVIKNADQAVFNMASSVKAANREFNNIGELAEWEETVNRLSSELVIYSDTALKNAVSRTVDMTKRLGLSKKQMEETIKVAADLGAGKVNLLGSIERVSAALRGESEAAEYLGLTLDESYIRVWYEANRQTEKAWKDLSFLEKGQIRYKVLMEQSAEMQGRAAASASTFGGAMALIVKETENAITKNKDVAEAMGDVADALRENSGEIGELVGQFVGLIAQVIEFAVKYKNMLLIVAGTGVAISVISKLAMAIQGLNRAWVVMTGLSLVQWFMSLKGALAAVELQTTLLATAFKGFVVFAGAYAVYQIGKATTALWNWYRASKAVREAQDNLAKTKARLDPMIAKRLKEISEATGLAVDSWEAFVELEEQAVLAFENGKWKSRLKEISEETGKIIKDWADFVALREQGEISFDKETGEWRGRGDEVKPVDDQALKDQARLREQLADELIAIGEDEYKVRLAQAKKHYDDQVKLARGNKELLLQIEKVYAANVKKIKEDQAAALLEKEKRLTTAQIKSQTERLKSQTQTALVSLQSAYSRAEMSLSSYFAKRRALIEKQYQFELGKLSTQLDAETDDIKKLQVEDQIFKLKEQHSRDLIALGDEELAAEQSLADKKIAIAKMLGDMKMRTSQSITSALNAQFAQEMAAMDQRHNDEIDRLKSLNAKKEEIDEAYRLHKLEKEQQMADQEQRLAEYRLNVAADMAGSLSDIFSDLYDATGEKNKELFYLSQAAAIAEATINAYAAANKAWAEGGILGKVQAAITLAGAMANVAKIKAQTLATGGQVLGYSPNEKADNVPIWATAGEFMQPVSSVRYYGKAFMEAIRRRLIPREIFKGFALPSVPSFNSFALASGGSVPAGSPGANYSITVPVSIPAGYDRLARALPGEIEDTVIRVMRREMR